MFGLIFLCFKFFVWFLISLQYVMKQGHYLLPGMPLAVCKGCMPLAGSPISECASVRMEFGLDLFQEENAIQFAMGK